MSWSFAPLSCVLGTHSPKLSQGNLYQMVQFWSHLTTGTSHPSSGSFGWSLLAWVEGPCDGLEDFNPQVYGVTNGDLWDEILSKRVGGGSFPFPFTVITTPTVVAVSSAAVLSCSLLQPDVVPSVLGQLFGRQVGVWLIVKTDVGQRSKKFEPLQ